MSGSSFIYGAACSQVMPYSSIHSDDTVGKGVKEIRLSEEGNQYRVICIAKIKDIVYVLHAFQKKTRTTAKKELDLARKRLKELI